VSLGAAELGAAEAGCGHGITPAKRRPGLEGLQHRPSRRVSRFLDREIYRDKLSREGVSSPRDRVRSLVVIVVMVVIRVMIVMVMVGHRVADGRAANPAHDGADWTAHHRSANGAGDPSCHRPTRVRERG
jgi:hypothetical protein